MNKVKPATTATTPSITRPSTASVSPALPAATAAAGAGSRSSMVVSASTPRIVRGSIISSGATSVTKITPLQTQADDDSDEPDSEPGSVERKTGKVKQPPVVMYQQLNQNGVEPDPYDNPKGICCYNFFMQKVCCMGVCCFDSTPVRFLCFFISLSFWCIFLLCVCAIVIGAQNDWFNKVPAATTDAVVIDSFALTITPEYTMNIAMTQTFYLTNYWNVDIPAGVLTINGYYTMSDVDVQIGQLITPTFIGKSTTITLTLKPVMSLQQIELSKRTPVASQMANECASSRKTNIKLNSFISVSLFSLYSVSTPTTVTTVSIPCAGVS